MAQRATNQQDGPKSHIHPQTKMAQGATDQQHEHKTKLREEGPSPQCHRKMPFFTSRRATSFQKVVELPEPNRPGEARF